ncbi:hypothetical protein Tcan_01105, partial [Toxocara canis]
MSEQTRIRIGDLVLDGTGDGQANADAMAAIRAAQLEANAQLPEFRFNNLIRSPIVFPRTRRRFLIPNHQRHSTESPSQATRMRRRASLRRVSAQRLLERRLSAQRQRISAHLANDAQQIPLRNVDDTQPPPRRLMNSQPASVRRMSRLRNSARRTSSAQRRRRALSADQASHNSGISSSNPVNPVASESTAVGISTHGNANLASTIAASIQTPPHPARSPATPPPRALFRDRAELTRPGIPNGQVSLFRSGQRPVMRTVIRWRQESTSSSASDESANALLTADGARSARPGSTPFRNLTRPATNPSITFALGTQRNAGINNNNSPLATITSRLGTASDSSSTTPESDTDTVHSRSATSQSLPATNAQVPSSGVRTATMESAADRTLAVVNNANMSNSSRENSESGSTQISTSSSR